MGGLEDISLPPAPTPFVIVRDAYLLPDDEALVVEILNSKDSAFEVLAKLPADINELHSDALYVCASFEGDVFETLLAAGLRVLGPPMIMALDSRHDLPKLCHQAQYTNVLSEVVACFTDFSPEDAERMRHRIMWMGGRVLADNIANAAELVAQGCTHIVATTATALVREARGQIASVVQPGWVEECWIKAHDGSVDLVLDAADLRSMEAHHRLPQLAGCVLFIDQQQLSAGLRSHIRSAARELGAPCLPEFDSSCTHYISNTTDTAEYAQALQCKAITVTHAWLFECVKQHMWCSETEYQPTPATNTATPVAAEASALPSMLQAIHQHAGSSPTLMALARKETPVFKKRRLSLDSSSGMALILRSPMVLDSGHQSELSPLRDSPAPSTAMAIDAPAVGCASPPFAALPACTEGSTKRKRESLPECATSPMAALSLEMPSSMALDPNRLTAQPLEMLVATDQKAEKRKHTVREMLQKEEHFLQDLKCLIEVFKEQLLRAGVMSPKLVDMIFANVEKLRNFSERIVEAISILLDNWNDHTTCMDEIFSPGAMKECLGLFRTYITGHEGAKVALDQNMKKSRPLRDLVRACEYDQRCRRARLPELLMRPVQHIARYTLYLKELQKNTPVDHPDGARTAMLIGDFTNILSQVNEAQASHERYTELFNELSEIDNYEPTLLTSQRSFVAKYELKLFNGRENQKRFLLVVFNDKLLLAMKHTPTLKTTIRQIQRKHVKQYRQVAVFRLDEVNACDVMMPIAMDISCFKLQIPFTPDIQCHLGEDPAMINEDGITTIFFQTASEAEKHAALQTLRDTCLAHCKTLPVDMQRDQYFVDKEPPGRLSRIKSSTCLPPLAPRPKPVLARGSSGEDFHDDSLGRTENESDDYGFEGGQMHFDEEMTTIDEMFEDEFPADADMSTVDLLHRHTSEQLPAQLCTPMTRQHSVHMCEGQWYSESRRRSSSFGDLLRRPYLRKVKSVLTHMKNTPSRLRKRCSAKVLQPMHTNADLSAPPSLTSKHGRSMSFSVTASTKTATSCVVQPPLAPPTVQAKLRASGGYQTPQVTRRRAPDPPVSFTPMRMAAPMDDRRNSTAL